jgi:adenine-specific DNA-methyltransferase
MKLKADQTAQKLRGAYYTPMEISDFLSSFAITKETQNVLEPSCGNGIFILSASKINSNVEIIGIELDEAEAQRATSRVKFSKTSVTVYSGNYFDVIKQPKLNHERFDAILGNPPYVRYQFIESHIQDQAAGVFYGAGLKFTKHTNLWVPFVVDSLKRLKPGGRLAMVIPRELLNVIHPGPLRKLLLQECSQILIIDPRELLFEEALQGTILLMASKKISHKENSRLGIMHAQDKSFLKLSPTELFDNFEYKVCSPSESKWMTSLLSSSERSCFEKASRLTEVFQLGELAQIEVGMVTGANEYFLINKSTAINFNLQKNIRPMVGRSQHLSGIVYGEIEHSNNVENDLPVFFVDFPNLPFEKLNKSLKAYVRFGEDQNLHTRYKTRIREPWYVVPSKWEPELFLLKRSNYFPRLVVNEISALNTDTAYRITSLGIDARKLAWCFVNSLTVISAELEGRSYGGGVLELVPSEIRRLVVPIVDCSEEEINSLNSRFIKGVAYEEILDSQDQRILPKLGLTSKEISTIQKARLKLQERRFRSTQLGVGGVRV